MEREKRMKAEGRVNEVIEIIDHEVVHMLNEELVELKASRRAKISLLDNQICGSDVYMQKEVKKV